MVVRRRTLLAAGAALPAAGLGALPAGTAFAGPGPRPGGATGQPLTNLAHLDFLGAGVRPARQTGHDTYRLGAEPEVGVLWTYADRQADGSYRRIGGGAFDPATGYYGQGAFNRSRGFRRFTGPTAQVSLPPYGFAVVVRGC